jgi:hypothetical protein
MMVITALTMEAARASETLVIFYQTTWRYNPEDSHLPTIVFHNFSSNKQNHHKKLMA